MLARRCGREPMLFYEKGGHGAIRELAERILQTRGRWQNLKRDGWRDRND